MRMTDTGWITMRMTDTRWITMRMTDTGWIAPPWSNRWRSASAITTYRL